MVGRLSREETASGGPSHELDGLLVGVFELRVGECEVFKFVPEVRWHIQGHGAEVGLCGDVVVEFVAVIDELPFNSSDVGETKLAVAEQLVIDLPVLAEHIGYADGELMRDLLPGEHGKFFSHVDGHGLPIDETPYDELVDDGMGDTGEGNLELIKQGLLFDAEEVDEVSGDEVGVIWGVLKHFHWVFLTDVGCSVLLEFLGN
jgi:hypothetical protein